MSGILQDDRVKWIRQRVILSLEIDTEAFDEYFTESLERARSAGLAREQIEEYLSAQHGAGAALFFSSHTWEEEIEGTYYFCLHSFVVILILCFQLKQRSK